MTSAAPRIIESGDSRQGYGDAAPRARLKVRDGWLPKDYDDLTVVIERFQPREFYSKRKQHGEHHKFVIVGHVDDWSEARSRSGVRGFAGTLRDYTGMPIHWFCSDDGGPLTRYLELRRNDGRLAFLWGTIVPNKGKWFIGYPEPIARDMAGRVRPIYPTNGTHDYHQTKKVEDLDKESYLLQGRVSNVAYRSVHDDLDKHIAKTLDVLLNDGIQTRRARIAAWGHYRMDDIRGETRGTLRRVHDPETVEEGFEALERMQLLAAIAMLHPVIEDLRKEAQKARNRTRKAFAFNGDEGMEWGEYLDGLCSVVDFALEDDQKTAIKSILDKMRDGVPSVSLLQGDVGSGKTVVFLLVAKAVVDAGGTVAVICPSTELARQTHGAAVKWMSECEPELIEAGAKKSRFDASKLVIGTTAIIRRAPACFDVVVCDEQQRFSRAQREEALKSLAHLIEVSATPIPRSQALAYMGISNVFRLRGCHVQKHIESRSFYEWDRRAMFAGIRRTVEDGGQVMVFFPARAEGSIKGNSGTTGTDVDETPLMSVDDSFAAWNAAFPDRVVKCHGGLDADEAQAAVDAMRNGEADVILCTTKLELGIDLPNVRHAVIMQADRFGLSASHQIRGRVARSGGQGYFDLYCPDDISDRAQARIDMLCETTDGFKIADADLSQRGGGDVSHGGQRQKGALPPSPFPDLEIPNWALEEAYKRLKAIYMPDG